MKKIIADDIEKVAICMKNKYIMGKIVKGLMVLEIIMAMMVGIFLINNLIDIVNNNMFIEISSNGIGVTIPNEIVNDLPKSYLIIYSLEESLIGILTVIIIDLFRKVCKNSMSNETPFTDSSINNLYRFGVILLVYNGISMIFSSIKYFILLHTDKINVIENIKDVSINAYSEIEFGSIFIALVIIYLAGIFKNGLELKKENESFI